MLVCVLLLSVVSFPGLCVVGVVVVGIVGVFGVVVITGVAAGGVVDVSWGFCWGWCYYIRCCC